MVPFASTQYLSRRATCEIIAISQASAATLVSMASSDLDPIREVEDAVPLTKAAQLQELKDRKTADGEPAYNPEALVKALKLAATALAASNVEMVDELVNMITAQRAYEMNSRVIQASDEMMSSINPSHPLRTPHFRCS